MFTQDIVDIDNDNVLIMSPINNVLIFTDIFGKMQFRFYKAQHCRASTILGSFLSWFPLRNLAPLFVLMDVWIVSSCRTPIGILSSIIF